MFVIRPRFVMILVALASVACKDDSKPDARHLPPPPSDVDASMGGGADARPAADASMTSSDARAVDASMTVADARPAADAAGAVDAPVQMPDATMGTPDAMTTGGVPDAPLALSGASLVINEVQPNIPTTNEDLVELVVTKAGTLSGIGLYQDITADVEVLAKLPDVTVAVGDIVVIHLQAPVGVENETTAMDDCTDAACYDTAWDFVGETGTSNQVGYSHRVLYLLTAPPESYIDAVVFMRHGNIQGPAAFLNDLLYVTGKFPGSDPGVDVWQSKCAEPCDLTAPNIQNAYDATVDWTGLGNSPTGDTVQRKAGTPNTRTVDDWQAGPQPQTLGLPN